MKKLTERELQAILDERPALQQEVIDRAVVEMYLLNDNPTTPEAERAGRRILLLSAKSIGQDYLMMSTKGKPDKVVTWLHTGAALAGTAPNKKGYIVIDKDKIGRPRRELTEAERQEIRARHDAKETINAIAKAMHLGTRRIIDALKD